MLKQVSAFFTGIAEFRHSFTTYYSNWREARAYDRGRELAHILTFRKFD